MSTILMKCCRVSYLSVLTEPVINEHGKMILLKTYFRTSFSKFELKNTTCIRTNLIFEITNNILVKRCHNIRSSGTDIPIPHNSENSEHIWCIDVNTRILSVSENFENFEYIWCIDVNTRILSVPENVENFEYIWCIDVNTRVLSVTDNFPKFTADFRSSSVFTRTLRFGYRC